MENFELNAEMILTSRQMLEACAELSRRARAYAMAHRDFKRERAKGLLTSRRRTVSEREAHADVLADGYRFKNYLEEGLMQAALEHVRCLRAKLSTLQPMSANN